MDRMREQEVLQFKQEVDERVKELESYLRSFKEELVKEGTIQFSFFPLSSRLPFTDSFII
jgi:hypothetical protein